MVYAILCKVIAEICHQVCIPLTPKEISHILFEVVDEDMVELVCRYMCMEGKLVRCLHHTFTLRRLVIGGQHRANILISSEYQQLGMQMLETAPASFTRYIPPQCEHRFLEIRPSTIGKAAGMGLFVRSTRKIPQGCIFCEYRGRQLRSLPGHDKERLYVVQVRNTSTFIDGVTSGGEHLSLATFINDNGPEHMNAGMMEFNVHPGKVFLVAARDLNPGEEIFVLYGPKYWGFQSYGEDSILCSSSVHNTQTSLSFPPSNVSSVFPGNRHRAVREEVIGDDGGCSLSSTKGTKNMPWVPCKERAHAQQADKSAADTLMQARHKTVEAVNSVAFPPKALSNKNGKKGQDHIPDVADARSKGGKRMGGGKRRREEEEDSLLDVMGGIDVENSSFPCRGCGQLVLRRTRALHQPHCGDPLVTRKLAHLDCMPLSSFTTVDHWDRLRSMIIPAGSGGASKHQGKYPSLMLEGDVPPQRCSSRPTFKATCMVDGDNPHTFAHTYMDVVKDLEFSFRDLSDSDK